MREEDLSFRRFLREELKPRKIGRALKEIKDVPLARATIEFVGISLIGALVLGWLLGNRNGIIEAHELAVLLPMILGFLRYWYWFWRDTTNKEMKRFEG